MPEPTAKLTTSDSHEDQDFWEILEKYKNKPIIVKHPKGLTGPDKFLGRIIIELFHSPGSRNDTSIAMTWYLQGSLNLGNVFQYVAEDLMSRTASASQLHNQFQT